MGYWGNYGGRYVRNVWGFGAGMSYVRNVVFFFFFWGWLLTRFPLPQMEIGEQRKRISGRRNPTIKKLEQAGSS